MPLNAKLFVADTLKLRVRSVVDELVGDLGNHFVQGITRETPNASLVSDRITLYAVSTKAYLTTPNSFLYRYLGPGAPFGGYVVSGAVWKTTLDLEVRIRGLKTYVVGPGLVTSHKWRQTWTSVEVWIEGALVITLPGSSGDEISNGLGPCYMPLIGIPLEITGGMSVREPAIPVDPEL